MENYYILRFGKELQRNMKRLRDRLYQESGHPGFLSLEGCIFLGPADREKPIAYIECPPLPITTQERGSFQNGMLFLPILGGPFKHIREQLETSFPFDGIYLGDQDWPVSIPPITIQDLSLAILTREKDGDITLWDVSSETHLYSDKDR